MSEPRAQLRLLGGCRIRTERGEVFDLRRDRATALLALLALRQGRECSRIDLAEALWPDAVCESAQGSLSTALWALRKQLAALRIDPRKALRSNGSAVWLDGAALEIDCHQFELTFAQIRLSPDSKTKIARCQAAMALYAGDLLPGLTEEWVYPERTRLNALYLQALAMLADLHAEAGELDEALAVAGKALEAEPLDVAACARLVRLYTLASKPATALRLHEDFVRQFRERMDMEPGEGLRALAEEARAAAGEVLSKAPKRVEAPSPRPASITSDAFSGGALPPDSPIYLRRPADDALDAALRAGESVVLIHGPRQTGKSSLLARGLAQARKGSRRAAFLDLQTLGDRELSSPDAFFFALARALADQIDEADDPKPQWEPDRGAARNLRHFLRRSVLPNLTEPLVWALDEVDRLFTCSFGNEVFGLFRSWHNERALDPQGPWCALTLILTYATEAHLFISDLNQSPFNVGIRLELTDFSPAQAFDLARKAGAALSPGEMERVLNLTGGHPYLLHRALHALAKEDVDLTKIETKATAADGLFFRHLSRLDIALRQDPALRGSLAGFVAGGGCGEEAFLRLRSAGVLRGPDHRAAEYRCGLYRQFLTRLFS